MPSQIGLSGFSARVGRELRPGRGEEPLDPQHGPLERYPRVPHFAPANFQLPRLPSTGAGATSFSLDSSQTRPYRVDRPLMSSTHGHLSQLATTFSR